jgi:carbonic anhydrase/acetyltransferase-like protein (isoleucine patch superfamily)
MEALGRAIAIAIALLAAFSAAAWVAAFVWALQDVRRRTDDIYVQLFASLLVLLLGPFGVVLYLILRPAETLNDLYLQHLQEQAILQEVVEPSTPISIHSVDGIEPQIGQNVYIAPGVQLIGDVRIADDVNIWHNTVIRADLAPISIGRGTNIQDSCVLHVDTDHPLVIGADVTVGHMAMLHACTIADECLIGIQSTLLSRAVIRRHSIVGAAALVGEGKEFEERNLILGVPARAVRTTTENEVFELIVERAREYRVSAARTLRLARTSST